MIKRTIIAALMTIGLMTVPSQAGAVKLGTLTCQIDGGVGLIIGSNQRGVCTFTRTDGRTETYLSEFSRLGVDIGVTGNKTIVWSVLGVGNDEDSLVGTYTGVNAEATAIVGVGANALIGGLDSGIVLNPVSISGQTGLAVAAGVASLRLE